MRSRIRLVFWWAGLGFFASLKLHAAEAAPIRLGWNAAPDPAVRGYAIYYGLANSPDWARIDSGANLTCTITGLEVGLTYRIYAVSYDVLGIESVPSNQVLFTAPAPSVPRLRITRLSNGNVQLNSTVAPGTICAVQFTTNLQQPIWQTLTTVTAPSSGSVVVTDTTARFAPQRFYRLFLP